MFTGPSVSPGKEEEQRCLKCEENPAPSRWKGQRSLQFQQPLFLNVVFRSDAKKTWVRGEQREPFTSPSQRTTLNTGRTIRSLLRGVSCLHAGVKFWWWAFRLGSVAVLLVRHTLKKAPSTGLACAHQTGLADYAVVKESTGRWLFLWLLRRQVCGLCFYAHTVCVV